MNRTEGRHLGPWESPETWTKAPEHAFNSIRQANRATMAAMGLPTADAEDRVEAGGGHDDWEVSTTVHTKEDIEVGDVVEFSKTLDEHDVEGFAAASGDTNPLHLDDEYASATRFDDRIVHGTLVSGLISAALARLPGLTIYVSQDIRFLGPVEIGDRVNAVCEVVEDLGDDQYRLTTQILDDDGEVIVDGEAIVLIDDEPELAGSGATAD